MGRPSSQATGNCCVKPKPDGRVRLYDLKRDPYEENDLSKEEPKQLETLTQRMMALDREYQLSRDGADYRF